MPGPVFILSSHQSFSALLTAMLGRNPNAYASPGLNLLIHPTVREFLQHCRERNVHLKDGALRFVAQLYAGEQTFESIEMARRWLLRRGASPTEDVMQELCRKVAPRLLIDRGPFYAMNSEILPRIEGAFPESKFIHLSRHPMEQGAAVLRSLEGIIDLWQNFPQLSSRAGRVPDPQIAWFETQATIMEFFETLPPERHYQLRAETLLAQPENSLSALCSWLELPFTRTSYEAMLQPKRWPFSGPGPFNAVGGTDDEPVQGIIDVLPPRLPSLDESVPWRPNEAGLEEQVKMLARGLGY
jgi:hypothetical protein